MAMKLSASNLCAGIWGSAFCIQLNRLLKDDKKVGELEALEQEREELGTSSPWLLSPRLPSLSLTEYFFVKTVYVKMKITIICPYCNYPLTFKPKEVLSKSTI